MTEATSAMAAAALKPSHRAVAVGLHEAALDSPTFRTTVAHFADQLDAAEKWLNGYVNSTSKLFHDVLALEETINTFISKTVPSTVDGVIDNDYTFLALKRVGDGTRETMMQLLGSTKRMEHTVLEPVRSFLMGDMRNFKEIRKVLEQSQRAYDQNLARYLSQSKTKEPSALREDAFTVYETHKAYIQASMDYCQLAPQVRFTMDKLLVKVSAEAWKEMKRSKDAATNATKWDQEMSRVRGWAKEMESHEKFFRQELQIARRDVGDSAMTGCKPSRELEDYSTSTVPFLGSRGPASMRPKDEGAVTSEKQGWLFLRTVSGKPARHTWVRRWYYCRDKVFGWMIPGPLGVLQGEEIGVLLCNAKPAPGEERRFCFEVKTKSQTLLLQAETQAELTEWLEVFEVVKKKAFDATMDRDTNTSGNADPAFSVSHASIPEFSTRTLDAHLSLGSEEVVPGVDRAGTLPVPGPDSSLTTRQSFDVNGTISRRHLLSTALKQDLAREEGESGREHAARIIQKLDLHRRATFGAGAEAALAGSSGSAGNLSSLISASHNLMPGPASSNKSKQLSPSMDNHPGTLAPLTLAKPPAVTKLSRTAVLTTGPQTSGTNGTKMLPSVLANYWGTTVYGAIHVSEETVLSKHKKDDPVGVMVLDRKAAARQQYSETFPTDYPPELRAQHSQFRLLFPRAPSKEKLVLVFRAAWTSSAAKGSNLQSMTGDGRIYVTPDNMYFYGQQMGLITSYRLSLDHISQVTTAPGKDCDFIFLHFEQDTVEVGYTRITVKVFLDDIQLLHARLNLLIDDLQAEEQMELEELLAALINIEREDIDAASPSAASWEEASGSTAVDDWASGSAPLSPRMRPSGARFGATPKLHIPSHPVVFEPDDMKEMAAERHFEVSAKSCFHVLFGDKSFVFPKLYFEHRAQQILQGPWELVDQGRMRREFKFKVDYTDLLGRSKTADVTDYQTIEHHSDHVTYVVTHVKTAWHLPYSQNFKLVTKIVITHMAKSRCKLAIYVRIDWSKSPALSRGLVERQALSDVINDAEELAEVATDQVRKLGARTRTNRAIQVYGHIGQQTQVVVFSPPTDSNRKQDIKPRTLTALVWETVRSFGESAVSSIIMWVFAGLKKLFEVLTANRLIVALLVTSAAINFYITSNETVTWWKERKAAVYMRRLGVGPNTMMSRAIYFKDLAEATEVASPNMSFPHNSTCFQNFEILLNATNMDALWEDSGSSFSSPTTKKTAQRLRRTRQRMGTYRYDLMVAMRIVNSIEREMLQSEWENWLVSENALCEDLRFILQSGNTGDGNKGSEAHKKMSKMSEEEKRAVEEFQGNYCSSCRVDFEGIMAERKLFRG